jgi:hypothetical protein
MAPSKPSWTRAGEAIPPACSNTLVRYLIGVACYRLSQPARYRADHLPSADRFNERKNAGAFDKRSLSRAITIPVGDWHPLEVPST